MKEKHTFEKILLIEIFAALLCGCSASTDNTQPQESEVITMQTEESTTNSESEILTSFSSESDLWTYLESTYPIVTKEEIDSGQYAGSYIIIDSTVKNVEITPRINYVTCDMYFATSAEEPSPKYFSCSYETADLQEYGCVSGQQYLSGMQNGDSLRGCYFVNFDNSFGAMHMLAIKRIGNTSAPDTETIQASDSADSRLKNATIFTADVYNGIGTEVIGQRAYIILPKSALQEITEEDYAQFLKSVVKDSGYNWFSIICDDGTGIIFNGCITGIGTYGNMDKDGNVNEALGYITLTDNGYVYEAAQ